MKKLLVLSLVLFLGLASCEEEKNARIEVWLTDAPGDFQEVNVDVQGVEIHTGADDDNGKGWQALDVTPQVHNLLKLTNGTKILLGDLELPAGKISQIRLKLGDNNSVKVDDETFELSTPSAQQSGLKVQIHQVLVEGITYRIVLDFDAAKSVVETGNNHFLLKPVIRAMTEAQDGAIKGKIDPAQSLSISVMSGEEVVTTTTSNAEGEFLIRGLETGTYRLIFDLPGDTPDVERSDVSVELGGVTDLGVVQIGQ